MRLPPLTSLRAFEAVGRLGNVRDAADELNVTPAAVGHQIRTLEDHLGVELFARGARGLQLTAPGLEFLSAASQAFHLLNEGVQRLTQRACVEQLVVNSLPSFAANFLVPRLSQFHHAHPHIEIEINTGDRYGETIDLRGLGVDVAIRAGLNKNAFPGLIAERLVPEVMFPVCTPRLMEGPAPIRTPEDLAQHTLIIVSRTPEGWPEWIEAARGRGWRLEGIDPHHGLRFDTIQLAVTAALQDMGVVIGRRPLIDGFLTSGALVAPFDVEVTSKLAYWLVYSPSMAGTPRLEAFRAWLKAELGLPDTDPV